MKERKSIDINSQVVAEAILHENAGVELYIKVGKKNYRIAGNEVKQFRDWLSKEVLQDFQGTSPMPQNRPETTILGVKPAVLGNVASSSFDPNGRPPSSIITVVGSLADTDAQAKSQSRETPLEERRAITKQVGPKKYAQLTSVPDLGVMHNGRPLKLQVENLSEGIEGAKEAFSPANLNKDVPM